MPSLPRPMQLCTQREPIFMGPSPVFQQETAIVIEYSIGEPFNKSGNGIRLCINVLCRGEKEPSLFQCSSCFKRAFSPPSLQAMRAKWHEISSSSVLCANVPPRLIFCMVISLISPNPSLCTPAWSRWRDTSSSTEGYCHEKPLRRFGSQPYFSPSTCSVCGAAGALMIFPGQAEVGVQVYI